MRLKKVQSTADLNEFISFPWKIYKDYPHWVPQLLSEYKFVLTENPFWEHAEKELYLAYDTNGTPVGRIAGIIDHHYNEFHNEKTGFFGFFESTNNSEVAQALYAEVAGWLSAKNISIMRGPTNPSTNDEMGFLCEGFDSPPRLMMPYNPEYYLSLAENAGLDKAKELYAYDMDVAGAVLQRLERITSLAYKKNPGLTVRKLNKKDFDNEIKKALAVYNAAWEKNWGFVPWTEKEFVTIAKRLKDLLLLDTTLLAEISGNPVAMLIAVPDYNFVMKKMNGSLFPTGIFKFLYFKNKIKALRLMIMGVVKAHRHKGIEGVLYYESLKNSLRLGFKKCEFSWVLDDNIMTQRACEMMGGKLYKKYRVYEKSLKQ